MIGLIRLHPVQGEPINVNPNHITFFGKNTETLTASISPNISYVHGTSGVLINSMFFQCRETENEIINALTRLRRKQEQNILNLRAEAEKEDWQGDTECDEEE